MNKKLLSISAIVIIALAFSIVAIRSYATNPATSQLVVYNNLGQVNLNVTITGTATIRSTVSGIQVSYCDTSGNCNHRALGFYATLTPYP